MKTIRYLLLTGMTVASLCGARSVLAQTTTTTTPPVVVVPNDGTGGVPTGIKTLITSFDKTRDKYLAAQDLLLRKLKNATTAAEREQIREQLQENRADFLAALKEFRQQLQDDLTALKGKISHEEFLRIIDAAHDAATEGGIGHHRGH
jgi:mevalonate kinase